MCARDHLIQSVTGRTTGGFPVTATLAPKALEHCDGEADGSRRIRWLGGASESRVLEEHRERNKERNRRVAEQQDRRERPTTGKYPWRLFLRKERRRLSLLKASQRALQAHACRGSSSDLPVPIRPDAVLTDPPTASP